MKEEETSLNRRVRGDGHDLLCDCRRVIDSEKDCCVGDPQGVIVREGVLDPTSSLSDFLSRSRVVAIERNLLAVGYCSIAVSPSGATKVSGASDDRRPNRLLRRLFPFPFDWGLSVAVPVLAVLVGVGGISSPECASRWGPVGDWLKSSSVTLRKLLRRVRLPLLGRVPKMLTPLPNDSGDAFTACGLQGVVGEPNSCCGRVNFPHPFAGAGVPERCGRVVFLDGVSGMFRLLPNDAGARSALRLRLEINPVDMKAAGSGFAIL